MAKMKVVSKVLLMVAPLTALVAGGYLLGREQAMMLLGWVLVLGGAIGLVAWLMDTVGGLLR